MIKNIDNKFNIVKRVIHKEELSVSEVLEKHNVTHIEIPVLRDFKNPKQLEDGKVEFPKILTNGKLTVKEIKKGFCGSVLVKTGSIVLELSLMYSDKKSEYSTMNTNFKLVQPWETITDKSGKERLYPIRPFSSEFRDDYVAMGNTYTSGKKEDGTPGKQYASLFLPQELVSAIKQYVDHELSECVYLPASKNDDNTFQEDAEEGGAEV